MSEAPPSALVARSRLSYAEAEVVGGALRHFWPSITCQSRAPRIAEEQWADIVQFVMRKADQVISDRPEKPGEAQ